MESRDHPAEPCGQFDRNDLESTGMRTSGDDDEFWQVAFLDEFDRLPVAKHDPSAYGEDCHTTSHTTTVQLGFPDYPSLSLSLSPLPLKDGIWSPLGAQAWYGSALLSSILLSCSSGLPTSTTDYEPGIRIQQHMQAQPHVSTLELGSGAVGLSGFALGWMLTHQTENVRSERRDRVVLTDYDPDILHQLQLNVSRNVDNMRKTLVDTQRRVPEYCVKYLDWNHEYSPNTLHDPSDSLQLVIGSELVYTLETAKACAHMVQSVLRHNARVLVVIVQVADRDGWSNVFVPTLQETEGCAVEEVPITDAGVHENASRLVKHGATLARFDFTLCFISNKNALSE